MVLVDTSVLIDYFKAADTKETALLDALLDAGVSILIGDLVLMELLQGVRSDEQVRLVLQELSVYPTITIGGPECTIQAAHHNRQLRGIGITPRKCIDTLIATRCILEDIPLHFSDRDFEPFVQHLGLARATLS
ncbi:PIN domain-containing protein [Candidatus Phycosocius spiralis]|uniref:Ribonuclease VapC n=1 Tax=Candidatus Phycosocius spiralis TaxID=2815099 RepID=A0ABQ4PW59_9PROT|nr:PIN domain-containing protein [Candidatus Phycosocius spiralis]GIU67286.1 ribonuclease VapC [Candidatus Phycosocius spiralis]